MLVHHFFLVLVLTFVIAFAFVCSCFCSCVRVHFLTDDILSCIFGHVVIRLLIRKRVYWLVRRPHRVFFESGFPFQRNGSSESLSPSSPSLPSVPVIDTAGETSDNFAEYATVKDPVVRGMENVRLLGSLDGRNQYLNVQRSDTQDDSVSSDAFSDQEIKWETATKTETETEHRQT